jgi:hypothetical protein
MNLLSASVGGYSDRKNKQIMNKIQFHKDVLINFERLNVHSIKYSKYKYD